MIYIKFNIKFTFYKVFALFLVIVDYKIDILIMVKVLKKVVESVIIIKS